MTVTQYIASNCPFSVCLSVCLFACLCICLHHHVERQSTVDWVVNYTGRRRIAATERVAATSKQRYRGRQLMCDLNNPTSGLKSVRFESVSNESVRHIDAVAPYFIRARTGHPTPAPGRHTPAGPGRRRWLSH